MCFLVTFVIPANSRIKLKKLVLFNLVVVVNERLEKRKIFQIFDHVNHQLHEVDLALVENEQNKLDTRLLFYLQYSNLRILQLLKVFLGHFCDTNKLED